MQCRRRRLLVQYTACKIFNEAKFRKNWSLFGLVSHLGPETIFYHLGGLHCTRDPHGTQKNGQSWWSSGHPDMNPSLSWLGDTKMSNGGRGEGFTIEAK